jgi:hypothetical protein
VNLLSQAPGTVTWVRVDKPQLDVVGLILGSLGLSGGLALAALLLGGLWGAARIRQNRRLPGDPRGPGTLHLDLRS